MHKLYIHTQIFIRENKQNLDKNIKIEKQKDLGILKVTNFSQVKITLVQKLDIKTKRENN